METNLSPDLQSAGARATKPGRYHSFKVKEFWLTLLEETLPDTRSGQVRANHRAGM